MHLWHPLIFCITFKVFTHVLSSWNWAYTFFLIFLFSQANQEWLEIGYHVLNTGLSPNLISLMFPDLISSSFLLPVDFPKHPATTARSSQTWQTLVSRWLLMGEDTETSELAKGTSLHRGEWSPQYSSSQKQNLPDCTTSEWIITEKRGLWVKAQRNHPWLLHTKLQSHLKILRAKSVSHIKTSIYIKL